APHPERSEGALLPEPGGGLPQRLKPVSGVPFTAGLKGLLHPVALRFSWRRGFAARLGFLLFNYPITNLLNYPILPTFQTSPSHVRRREFWLRPRATVPVPFRYR